MKRPPTDDSFNGDFSEQIAVGRESLRQTRDPQQATISAAATEPQCFACGSWALYPLGLVSASSTETRAAMSPQGAASPHITSWLAGSHPPEKMTAWTGFTLALLLWPPCIFLLAQMLYTRMWTGRPPEDSPSLYLVAIGVGVIAWVGPALRRRRQAHSYNSGPWKEEMREWHAARVCLKCGSRLTSLDRLTNRMK